MSFRQLCLSLFLHLLIILNSKRMRYKSLLILILVSSFFTSCKKVIHLDLNSSEPQLFIEGNIYDHSGPFNVKLYYSVNFDQSNNYPPAVGAIVSISDDLGNSEQLTEKASGLFYSSNWRGISGRTYILKVNLAGKIYTATSTMPPATQIASIFFQKSLFGNELFTGIDFSDNGNSSNYYRLVYFVNNVQQPDIHVTDNRLSQGKTISYLIRPSDTAPKLKSGDKVTIRLEAIDQGVFEYLRTASHMGGQSASPANPISNISNGALGYFNASASRSLSVTVP